MSNYKSSLKALELINLEYLRSTHHNAHKSLITIIREYSTKKLLRHIRLLLNRKELKILSVSPSECNLPLELWEKTITSDKNYRVVVYSCISGNYDNLQEPLFVPENVDYVMFSDIDFKSEHWQIRSIPDSLKQFNQKDQNRYMKMHPSEFLKDYDYAIYIDGNVSTISDLTGYINLLDSQIGVSMHTHVSRSCIYKEARMCELLGKGDPESLVKQVTRYRHDKFPENFGMLECTLISSEIANKNAKDLLDKWWIEYKLSESGRDQISLPYVIWKNKVDMNKIGMMGKNLYIDPKIRVASHW